MAICNKPCNECPFRRKSWPGYLGDADGPEEFLSTIEGQPIPCHLTVEWDRDDSQEQANEMMWKSPCIGSLQYLKNQCKLPRDPLYRRLLDGVEKNDDVFKWRGEFIKHHEATET